MNGRIPSSGAAPAPGIDAATYEQLHRTLTEQSPREARAVVGALLDAGHPPLDVLEAIAAVQRDVGGRWERGEWTVTEEHRATGVASVAVETVGAHVRAARAPRGRVVVACAEREWHGLAQALVATALRSDGWEVTSLGPSSSLQRFSRALHDLDPDATALSCSLLRSLPSARSFIQASTEAGVPLLAGGAGFGADDRRALAMGASLWAGDLHGAVSALARPLPAPPPVPPVSPAALHEWAHLDRTLRPRAENLRTRWAHEGGAPDSALAATVVEELLGAVLAALVTADETVLGQALAWCERVLAGRGEGSSLAPLGTMVARELRDHPVAADLVARNWGCAGDGAGIVGIQWV